MSGNQERRLECKTAGGLYNEIGFSGEVCRSILWENPLTVGTKDVTLSGTGGPFAVNSVLWGCT